MTTGKKSIAVILSGCGNQDGSEIHEATLTLWAIQKNNADYQCYAPNILQHHVINHLTGKEMDEKRNVLIESARIARGNVIDLAKFNPEDHDALVIPGGLGAAKNLSSFAFDGAECHINTDVETAILKMAKANKAIGALCISPVILAKVLDNALVTVGQSQNVIGKIRAMNARHESTMQSEIVVDKEQKLVTTPCYMLDARVDQIADGADRLIQAILAL
jgi:enhancing lycopene biosynthesis protein 2